MNAFLATVRAVYFLAAIFLFGELAVRWWLEGAASRRLSEAAAQARLAVRPRFATLAIALAAAFASSVLWFLAQIQVMSGVPLAALNQDTLHGALFDTEFGQASLARFGLAIALAVVLALLRKQERSRAMAMAAGVIALGLLSTIAWTGHANGDQGQSRVIHLSADLMHLLAAGVWLGALPALAWILFRARRDPGARALEFAALATRRFSTLGIAAVSTLALSGIVNSWYTLGSLPALLGTDYGRLLFFKLLLFAFMLGFAATNRFRYTPRLRQAANSAREASCANALVRLGVNATAEIALGMAVVCVVGALGVTTPAAHGQTLWPFQYTLSLAAARDDGLTIAVCLTAFVASTIFALRVLRRRRMAAACAAGVALVAAYIPLSLLAVPANPTTYYRSPMRYSAESISIGGNLYAEQCSICHGSRGHGDGPAAAPLAEHPADLTEHMLHHREGDVFWWISHGIPGTPMPAFDARLRESDIWNVINWLRVQAEAEEAKHMGDAVHASAFEAPNFSFQIDHEPQESLADQRDRSSVLLVLFDPAESLDRVRALSRSQRELGQAGVRVIAIPTRAEEAQAARLHGIEAPIVASFDRQIASAYAAFAPVSPDQGDRSGPKEAEFLIDRQGCLRARWTPDDGPAWLQLPYLLSQVLVMEREPRPCLGASDGHAH